MTMGEGTPWSAIPDVGHDNTDKNRDKGTDRGRDRGKDTAGKQT